MVDRTVSDRMKRMRERKKQAGLKDIRLNLDGETAVLLEALRLPEESVSATITRIIHMVHAGQVTQTVTSYATDLARLDTTVTHDEREAFHKTYLKIGKGKSFVRIHRIKEGLGWYDGRFYRVLEDLVHGYVVELHGGDPSELSKEELAGCYVDEQGMLYIALTWLG